MYLIDKNTYFCIILLISVGICFSSCCTIGDCIVNKDDSIWDYHTENDTVVFRAGLGHGFVEYSDFYSMDNGFMYGFSCYIKDSDLYEKGGNPPFTIHTLSFTTKAGDIIPYQLFYYQCDKKEGNRFCRVDSMNLRPYTYPINITRNMREDGGEWGRKWHNYTIFAVCNTASSKLKKVYVNYDVEVYGKHFVAHSLYRKKLVIDCRPKLWK